MQRGIMGILLKIFRNGASLVDPVVMETGLRCTGDENRLMR